MMNEQFKELSSLIDFNIQVSEEVKKMVGDGKIEKASKEEVIEAANKCFMELNFLSAAAIFEKGFDRFKGDGDFLYSFGYFLYECQFLKLSEEMLRMSIKVQPGGDPRKYFTLGEMYVNQESLDMYMKGIKLAEAMGESLQNEMKEMNEADIGMSDKQKTGKQKIQMNLNNVKRTVAQAYCAVSELLMNHPDFPNNTNDIDHALKRAEHFDPEYYEVIYQKAMYFFNIQNEAKCREQISLFVQKMKGLDEAEDESILDYSSAMLTSLARMMIEGGIYEDGAYISQLASSHDHTNSEAWYMYAFCSLCSEDLDSCQVALNRLKIFDLSKDKEIKQAYEELCQEFKEALSKSKDANQDGEEGWEDVQE